MKKKIGIGGDGEVFIAARNIVGTGTIEARGGEGFGGGKAKVTLITDNNNFEGTINAIGGASQHAGKKWYLSWWMKFLIYPILTGVIVTLLLKTINIL